MSRITEGHLVRHIQGKAQFRDAALLDIAQDHALAVLHRAGAFELGLVFKGGTALRKFRAGNQGRLSTDLDFAAGDPVLAELVITTLNGAELDGFRFEVDVLVEPFRRAAMRVDTPFGPLRISSTLDLNPKAAWLAPELAEPVALPIHDRYSFRLPPTPVMRLEEVLAEKLARFRRTSLARDLFDLAHAADRIFDAALLRRLTVLKVYVDVVHEGLGEPGFEVGELIRDRHPKEFRAEAIGYLTTPIDLPGWIDAVRRRYAVLAPLSDDEQRWARCNPGDVWEVDQEIARLSAETPTAPGASMLADPNLTTLLDGLA